MHAASHHSRFMALMAALIATAWLTLWLWGQSPYAGYLDHGGWAETGLAGSICSALPGVRGALTACLVAGGWVLMLSAMMLPTTLPLLDIFRRLTVRHADRGMLTALVVVGYLAVWGLFGLAAHLVDWGVVLLVRRSDWLVGNVWAIGAAVLAAAGIYQFTELKYRCLDKCRAPLGFVVRHWRGAGKKSRALLLGARHGAFCVGCCWCLMLLMFVVGSANIGWMLALGAVMAAGKNLPAGRRLAAPIGAALLLAAVWVAISAATA
jgi:predicted metal-binding membrane protein